MKCPQCQHDAKKSEREGSVCPQCKRRFRLDPPVSGLSDYAVDAIVKKLTDNGAHKYVKRQLVAALERRLVASARGTRRVFSVLLGVSSLVLVAGALLTVWPLVLGATFFSLFFALGAFTSKADPTVAPLVASVFGTTPGEVAPRELQPAKRGAAREFDLESYGFDRVIVVQGDDLAEMLVANQFHFQHNAAIVSFDGYPAHVASLVDKQLHASPTTTVVLLHDASALGYELAEAWLVRRKLAPSRVIRAGLVPRQADKLSPKHAGSGHAPKIRGLPAADATWLAASSVSLAALKPGQVMTLLFNAIQRKPGEALATVHGAESDFLIVGSDGGYDFG
jgi:hypothetical protein